MAAGARVTVELQDHVPGVWTSDTPPVGPQQLGSGGNSVSVRFFHMVFPAGHLPGSWVSFMAAGASKAVCPERVPGGSHFAFLTRLWEAT